MAGGKPRFDAVAVEGGVAGLFAALRAASQAERALDVHVDHEPDRPPALERWQ